MPLTWITALKVFNEGKSAWCVPKKGGTEYDEVVRIRNRTSPDATEARNVERRAKAMEQLKALDTRKDIDRKRAERKAKEARDLPKGITPKQVNTWGSRTDAGGDPPYVQDAGRGATRRVYLRIEPSGDNWRVSFYGSSTSLTRKEPSDSAVYSPKEVGTMLSKQAWWKTWMKRYGHQFK